MSSGLTYRVSLPPVTLSAVRDPAPQLSVHTGPDGVPVLLLADEGGQVYRLRASAPVTIEPQADRTAILRRPNQVSPDQRYSLEIDRTGRLDLVELATKERVASVAAPRPPATTLYNGEYFAFTPDTRRFLIAEGSELVVRTVPSLAEERRITLPVPALGKPPEADGVTDAWASSVLPSGNDRAVVLHAGQLLEVDLASGRVLGDPLPVRPAETPLRQRLGAQLVFAPSLAPGNPDRVSVVNDTTLQVWSMSERRILGEVEWPAKNQPGAVVFDRTGDRVAAIAKGGLTRVWPVDDPGDGQVLPTAVGDSLVGFTPVGTVVVQSSEWRGGAQVWDPKRGKQLVAIDIPPAGASWQLVGDKLIAYSPGLNRSLELNADLWFRELCATADRPFTPDELKTVKDDQGRTDPPCP